MQCACRQQPRDLAGQSRREQRASSLVAFCVCSIKKYSCWSFIFMCDEQTCMGQKCQATSGLVAKNGP